MSVLAWGIQAEAGIEWVEPCLLPCPAGPVDLVLASSLLGLEDTTSRRPRALPGAKPSSGEMLPWVLGALWWSHWGPKPQLT